MDIIQLAIQGGAVGIAIYAIYTLKTLSENHMVHMTDALNRLENAVIELTAFLKSKKK